MNDAAAAVVVPTPDLAADVDALRYEAGFRLDRIMPADDPSLADLSGHGIRLRLRREPAGHPVLVEVPAHDAERTVVLAGGSSVAFRAAADDTVIPDNRPELVATHVTDGASWVTGRAGMRYRDLLPGRWGGRFIASHIHIPGSGPVPDDVHSHRIRFQVIAVRSGEVEVVYEDQGPPFVMRAGDCVLQPPGIRHRVLHSSDDLEVVEVGCPAEHETRLDHVLALPTDRLEPDRVFGGQRFVRHVAAEAPVGPWRLRGWLARDSGIESATGGLARVLFARPGGEPDPPSEEWSSVESEFELLVVMQGDVEIEVERMGRRRFEPGDSVALPSGVPHRLLDPSERLELMEVHLP